MLADAAPVAVLTTAVGAGGCPAAARQVVLDDPAVMAAIAGCTR